MIDRKKNDAAPRLLSGGNPQIPKGEGNRPVAAYIEAMPEWKRDLGERLDALIVSAVPESTRPSSGTNRSTASRAMAGSCRSAASPNTCRCNSSGGRHSIPSRRKPQSTTRFATSTSTRTTNRMRTGSAPGSSRLHGYRARRCDRTRESAAAVTLCGATGFCLRRTKAASKLSPLGHSPPPRTRIVS